MASSEQQKPAVVALNEKQKQAVLEELRASGGTFFSWEELQAMMLKMGPNATIAEVQQALASQNSQTKKQ